MLRLLLLAIVAFLVWVEVIPIRRWYFEARIRIAGICTRLCIEVLDFFITIGIV